MPPRHPRESPLSKDKTLQHFILSLTQSPPPPGDGPEDGSLSSHCGILVSLVPEAIEQTLFLKSYVVSFDLFEGCLKDWCKAIAFVLPDLELSQHRKVTLQRAFLKIERQMKNSPLSRAKQQQQQQQKTSWHKQRTCWMPWRKSRRVSLQKMKALTNFHVCGRV